jgi:hypothetical protein
MVALARSFTSDIWNEVLPLTDLPPMLIDRLRELSQLGDDWDGYASPRITEPAKQSAVKMLSAMRSYAAMPSMQLDPVSGGGLQFSWEIGTRGLEVEILPDGAVEYLVADGDDMVEGALNDLATLLRLLRWLLRS